MLAPGGEVVPQHARHVARGLCRRAHRPEVLERVEPDGGDTGRGQPRGEFLVESRPATVPGEQQREFVAIAGGVDFLHRQVADVRGTFGRGLDARREPRVGVAKLRHPVAFHRKTVPHERQPYHLRGADLRGKRIHRGRGAHLIFLALEGDPRLLQVAGRLEQQFVLLIRRVVQAGARAQLRAGEVLVGAEAEAERAGKSTRR